jgi:hypothetical protein
MNLRIKVEETVSPLLARMVSQLKDKSALHRAMGVEVQRVTVEHLEARQAGSAKAKAAAGRPHTGWFAKAAQAAASGLTSDGTAAVLTIKHPGISRAFRDVEIRPKTARALAIPIHAAAYGKRAGELWDRLNLFIPKGKRVICANLNGELTPLYFLTSKVSQKQDRTMLPSDAEFREAGETGVRGWLKEMLATS